MKKRLSQQLIFVALISIFITPPPALATNAVDSAKRAGETQVRNLLEPLIERYCRDECKLLGVSVDVDLAAPDEIAPGFDEIDPRGLQDLIPKSAKAKLLVDEKVGPVSRAKILDLLQQYLETLEYPVKLDTQVTRFPQPIGSAGKVAEIRQKIEKRFRATLEELFTQFCPDHCMVTDLDLQTQAVNPEEAQYGNLGEFVEEGGSAVRIKDLSATLLVDDSISAEERANILEMAKLKTNYFRNVNLAARTLKFPTPLLRAGEMAARGLASIGPDGQPLTAAELKTLKDSKESNTSTSDSKSRLLNETTNATTANSNSSENKTATNTANSTNASKNENLNTTSENNQRQERFERFEKIERVESGDAVQKELKKFMLYGLIFACAMISLLIFIALAAFRKPGETTLNQTAHRMFPSLGHPDEGTSLTLPESGSEGSVVSHETGDTPNAKGSRIARRYDIERLLEELTSVFAQHPKVAKYVFSRILTEEGVETTSAYIHLFGEGVVMDVLRDPSLQSDMNELLEYHAKNPIELSDEETIDLLRRLQNRTAAGKLTIMASRSSNLFEYLSEMDGTQILELIRNESVTVKAIVLTQCDPHKRTAIYAQVDEDSRMKLMTELSRIDYLPRDFIYNVSQALKRKRRENPRLNTEALPGSDVLLTLLERSGREMARTVIKNLELTNPESARNIKNKLVTLDTLKYLRDGQLLEVVLALKHDELLQFLKGAPDDVRQAIFTKAPRDLVADLEEELVNVAEVSRESFQVIERRVLNRMKIMANDGLINLVDTNDRMLANANGTGFIEGGPVTEDKTRNANVATIKKVAGW